MGKLKELGIKYGQPSKPGSSDIRQQEPITNEHATLNANGIMNITDENNLAENAREETSMRVNSDVLAPMSWIRISKIVLERKQDLLEELSSIYAALHECAATIALVLKKENGGLIHLYLGVRDIPSKGDFVSKYVLQRGLSGCLPGISYQDEQFTLNVNRTPFVALTTGVPTLKNGKQEDFVQGVERLINSTGNVPTFTVIFIAENVSNQSCALRLKSLNAEYSRLSVLAETTTSISDNKGTQASKTETRGSSSTSSKSATNGTNESRTKNSSLNTTDGTNAIIANSSQSKTLSDSTTSGSSNSTTKSESTTENSSTAEMSGESLTKGTSVQTKKEDKEIKEELKRIEHLIEHISSSVTIGMWNYSAYFLSGTKTTAYALACIHKGLICGKIAQPHQFNIMDYDEGSSMPIIESLMKFQHPSILNSSQTACTSLVDCFELSLGMSLPLTSIPGVLVREQASYGRNVEKKVGSEDCFPIGNVNHLGNTENTNPVELEVNLLTSHMFITGATGSGKSNTIYGILSHLLQRDIKCLIIEPAKGEYKNVFGGRNDFKVLGTNPNIVTQLRINPFSFPEGVHVEEHIDRLIDIFNACWPMYAAMPAVLKESICRAYESCGWDLTCSKSNYGVFPNFDDIKRELGYYINESEYSSDSKGDYKGALCTRIESLTNGIVGQLFTGESISEEELFNQNVIVDLSRVGSFETKSLIMGLLVIKLNEFRMSENVGMNLPLRHITVLEESHNLLREISGAQSQESSNVAGKSVEMLASAIAEMRTYGEGFIIADQSPSLLDRSAISNTNTKIVMNLPNRLDREIVANSIVLTEQQTNELSKLKTGIAVVYQRGWEEPVQCLISRYENKAPFNFVPSIQRNEREEKFVMDLYHAYTDIPHLASLIDDIRLIGLSGCRVVRIINLVNNDKIGTDELCPLIFVAYVGEALFVRASRADDISAFNFIIKQALERIEGIDRSNVLTFLNMYVKGCSLMNKTGFYETWLVKNLESKNEK